MNYPTFNDIMNPKLQAYNRLNVIYNIKEHVGGVMATRYAEQFSKKAKAAIMIMHESILTLGYSSVRKQIMKAV